MEPELCNSLNSTILMLTPKNAQNVFQEQWKDLRNKTYFLFHSEAGIPFFKYATWTIFSGQFSVRPLWLSTLQLCKVC